MSVTKLRESTEKKGCMIAVWIIMMLALIGLAGTGFFGCFSSGMATAEDAHLNVEVVTVNGTSVPLGTVNRQIEFFSQLYQGGGSPEADYQIMAPSLSLVVDQQIALDMAKKRGITIDADRVLANVSEAVDGEIRQMRLQAVTAGDLKESATEAEFQNYFQETVGVSVAEYKERGLESMRELLKKPYVLQAEAGRYAFQELQQAYMQQVTVSDEEIKKSFEKLQVLNIRFDNIEKSLAEREQEASQALAEIKAGADFLDVQKKYMKNPVAEPADLYRNDLERNEALKPLSSLKAGETSEVLVEFGTPSIYKVVGVSSELPSDYEANKAVYADTVKREKAGVELDKDFQEQLDSASIVWKSEGFGSLYEVLKMQSGNDMNEEQVKERLLQIVSQPLGSGDDPAGLRPAVVARYRAMQMVEPTLTADERKANLENFVLVLIETLDQYESVAVRLRLVDFYTELGQNDEAAAMLLMAAQNNSGFDPINVDNFAKINETIVALESGGKISDEAALEIRNVLAQWSRDKNEAEEMERQAQEELDKFNIDPSAGGSETTGETTGATAPATTGN